MAKGKTYYQYWKSVSNGQYYFHKRAANNQTTSQSEGYIEKRACIAGIIADARPEKNPTIKFLKQDPNHKK